ncbi:MAG: carboxypeptidase-like regulatory domain-containing protein [Tannerellaceae bacterium]|nr:carboxypeptidase-like regulatory domain-containing protein [Tannerellaceae bacterium]
MKYFIFTFILLAGMIQNSFAQNIDIRGIVRDAKNREPAVFANIVLQTTDSMFVKGTTTDSNGHFSIQDVKPSNYLLVVSSLGYKTKYLPVNESGKDILLESILLEEELISLSNVTVNASNMSSRIDKKVIYPSERQLKASTNGVDLLQQLMLPKLQVNPLFNEVSLPGGGELQYRINGVKVEAQDIIALQPADIIRVEFYDNPGLRYGNAEVVLDYIVRRPETGGSFGVNLDNSPFIAWGNNGLNAKLNHKKSEFGINYGISHRDFYKMWRDNEENFTFADGTTFQRREIGEPGHGEMYWQSLNGTYSYQDEQKMFSATVRHYGSNSPHMDYKGSLYNVANPFDAVYMIDKSSNKTNRPALDLYYQHNLKNGQTIVLNAVGTYNYTNNERMYQESRENRVLTDVNSLVVGKKYSFIGEGIYEKKFGINRLSAGLKHMQATSDNEYKNGVDYLTKMNQAETFLYSEFKGRVQELDYTAGVGVTRSHFGQDGDDSGYNYYTFNPRLVLQYALPGKSSIRLKADISNGSPQLSDLSNVEVTIDSVQIQRGNPHLRPFLRYRAELTYELEKGVFYGNLWNIYEYQPDAIMDEKRLEGHKIVQTWDNQKNWQRLASRLMIRVGPVKDILQLSVTGGVNHYISNGNTYNHTYTNWFMNGDISAVYKKVSLGFGVMTNWNWFYGETMNGGENLHYAMLSYKHKNLAIAFSMYNPFVDNYKQDTGNWSRYASYHRSNYIKESSRMIAVRVAWNFSFGRTFKAEQKRINNADDDSGVMSSGK